MTAQRPSYVTFEEPDIVFWHLIGKVEEHHVVRIYDEMMQFCRNKSNVFVLMDVSQMQSMTPAARRTGAAGPVPGKKVIPVQGNVVIGASFHIKVLGLLVTKAAHAFNPDNEMVVHYCDTELEARKWLDKRRRDLGIVP